MNISRRTIYGFRFLVYLAKSNSEKNVQLGEIARAEDISVKYLEKIVQIVKGAGLLTVTRGFKGGYRLNRAPEKISAKDLFYLLEGVDSIVNDNEDVNQDIGFWSDLDRTIENYLSGISLKDLAEESEIQNMYYI